MDLETALADAEASLADAERQLAELTERIETLSIEKRGLELSLARHRGESSPAERPKALNPWVPLARTDAIIKIMEEASDPLSPTSIVKTLADVGREGDTSHNVSAALSYLQGQNKVRSLGRGRWVLAETPLPVTDATSGPDVEGHQSSGDDKEPPLHSFTLIRPGDPRSDFHPAEDKEAIS